MSANSEFLAFFLNLAGFFAGKQRDQRHAERINIRGGDGAAFKLLERHVAIRADNGRAAADGGVIRADFLAHCAEINQHDAAFRRNDNIARLDVAMNNRRRKTVQIVENIEDFQADFSDFAFGKLCAFRQLLRKAFSVNILLHKIELHIAAAFHAEKIEVFGNLRMM